jgi:hypothetical protein
MYFFKIPSLTYPSGFDFSNAEVTGTAPDPRTFLGGVDYNKINENRGRSF